MNGGLILAAAVCALRAGQRDAWFGLGLILAALGYFAVRWMHLAVRPWLAALLLLGTVGAGACLAFL